MLPLENVDCLLCNEDHSTILHKRTDVILVKCISCGLHYLNPRIQSDHLRSQYSGDYSAGYLAKKRKKIARARRIVGRILKYKSAGTFLDIGCSGGFILNEARSYGFKTYGLEVSPIAVDYAKNVLNLNIQSKYLEEAAFPSRFFDVITMYNTLEHISDPLSFLRETARIAKEDALIEIWVPDIGHLKAKFKGDLWQNIFPEHLYYFTRKTLSILLNRAGLTIYKDQFTLKDGIKTYVKLS